MASAPVNRVDVFVTFPVSLYVEEDRVEIGKTNLVCQEEMSRIAYRDVRRIVTWTDRMMQYLFLGGFLLLVSAGFVVMSFMMDEVPVLVMTLGTAVVTAVLAIWSLHAGRKDGITRIRIEGLRASIEGVIGGSETKRAALLADLERRVRERQSV